MKKVIKNSLMLSIGQALSLVIGAISTLIYGIVFSKPQIAVISLFDMVSQLFFSFGFKWSTVGIIRFGKEEFIEYKTINHTSSVRLVIIIPIMIFSVILILFYRKSMASYIGVDENWMIFYLTMNITINIINDHITTLLNTAERYGGILFLTVTESLGRCLILSVMIINKLNITAEFYLQLLVYWPILLFFLRLPFLKTNYILPFKFKLSSKEIKKYIKFVYPQIYGFAGLYLINWMDLYFIRLYSTMENLGAYQFTYSIFSRICSFAYIFNNILFPKIMTWKKNNDVFKLNKFLKTIPQLILFITIIGVFILLLIYPIVFKHFFGNKFVMAYSSFNILLGSIPFFMATYLYVPVLNCYDKVMWIQTTNIISALANFLVDFFFIRHYGIVAASAGTFICYFLKYSILLILVRQLNKSNWGVK